MSDFMQQAPDTHSFRQRRLDENAVLTAVEETVGVAIKFFKSYGARCNALEHIQNALPICDSSINRCAGAFRKGFAFGLADVEAIAQVKADLLMSRAVFVLYLVYMRTDDLDPFFSVGHNPIMLFPVSVLLFHSRINVSLWIIALSNSSNVAY